jgi:hypothetical protein
MRRNKEAAKPGRAGELRVCQIEWTRSVGDDGSMAPTEGLAIVRETFGGAFSPWPENRSRTVLLLV